MGLCLGVWYCFVVNSVLSVEIAMMQPKKVASVSTMNSVRIESLDNFQSALQDRLMDPAAEVVHAENAPLATLVWNKNAVLGILLASFFVIITIGFGVLASPFTHDTKKLLLGSQAISALILFYTSPLSTFYKVWI